MKIEVYVSEIKKALNIIYKGISSKPHLPILSGFLIEVKNGKTSLISTDLEISFWTEVEALILEEGIVVVPAKLFFDLVSTLDDVKITITLIGSSLRVETKGLVTEIVCHSSEEYPSIPRATLKGVKLVSETFKKKIDKVIISSAKDDTRPILTGILFSFKEDQLSLVATDGFRLSLNNLKLSSSGSEALSVVIPARSVVELTKTLSETSANTFLLEVDKNAKQVIFSFSGTEMSARILDGDFPPYQQIIPNTYSTQISLSRQALLSAVKRAGLFARDNANVVKVEVGEKLLVSAENSQLGSNVSEIEAEIEGNKFVVAFNSKYLLDFLPVVDSDQLGWETEGELKPSVFRDTSDLDWLQVVMPIRTQG